MALAEMLKSDFAIVFFYKKAPESIVMELRAAAFEVVQLNEESQLLAILNGSQIVVLDHYNLGSEYQKSIKTKGCKLVCIDDLHDKIFFADLIINHAPGVKSQDYLAQVYTQYALGLNYVLLRSEFLKNAISTTRSDNIDTVFVCFGGADFKNITQVVVDILKSDKRFKRIFVVVGISYHAINFLEQSILSDNRFELHQNISASQMRDLMLSSHLAIIPSSGILQEAMSLKLRTISGMCTENQRIIFENYKNIKAFESAENFEPHNVKSAIDRCFAGEVPVNASELIDGKAGHRHLKCFQQLCMEDDVLLKNAVMQDVDLTYQWATDHSIRMFSFNRNPIKYDEHYIWFNKNVLSDECYYYIGFYNNTPIGSVRFDICGDGAAISYLVAPEVHGNSFGTILLKKSLLLFMENVEQNINFVFGEVKLENKASIRIFEKLGYTLNIDFDRKLITAKKVLRSNGC